MMYVHRDCYVKNACGSNFIHKRRHRNPTLKLWLRRSCCLPHCG